MLLIRVPVFILFFFITMSTCSNIFQVPRSRAAGRKDVDGRPSGAHVGPGGALRSRAAAHGQASGGRRVPPHHAGSQEGMRAARGSAKEGLGRASLQDFRLRAPGQQQYPPSSYRWHGHHIVDSRPRPNAHHHKSQRPPEAAAPWRAPRVSDWRDGRRRHEARRRGRDGGPIRGTAKAFRSQARKGKAFA